MKPIQWTKPAKDMTFPDVIHLDLEEIQAIEEAIAALPYGSQDPDVEKVRADVKAKIRAARELRQSS